MLEICSFHPALRARHISMAPSDDRKRNVRYTEQIVLVNMCRIFIKNGIQKIRSNACIEGPGRFRKVRKTCIFHPATISPLNSFMVPSYDKTD